MRNAQTLGGQAATGTKSTMTALIWLSEVENAAIAQGVNGEWLRDPRQRKRLNLYHAAGEPVWMAADSMIQFWRGAQVAAKDDSASLRRIVRDAIRRQA